VSDSRRELFGFGKASALWKEGREEGGREEAREGRLRLEREEKIRRREREESRS
jgi:hypothetical protein